MPKYDAFGREIGEDTLQGLGGSPARPDSAWEERTEREEANWQAAEQVEVTRLEREAVAEDAQAERAEDARQAGATAGWTAPAPDEAQRRKLAAQLSGALQQAATTRSGSTPSITVRRSGGAKGCLIALVVLLAIGAAGIAGILSLVNTVDDATDGIESVLKAPEVDDGPKPTGFGEGSLMRPAAVKSALATLNADEVRLTNLRLAPERIDATLLTTEGRLRHVQIKPGGKLERFGSDGGEGFDKVPTIGFSKLNPAAPQRLARRGAKELGVPVSTVQYAVPQDIRGEVRWVVYFKRGQYVIGGPNGGFDKAYP
jgi:hypothetical protein